MEKGTHLLEINLISAQGLKPPSANLRRLQTYAIAWVDPSAKLRTGIDRLGGQNPTWNEKFIFRVTSDFLYGDTSGVSVEIYAVGYIKDPLVGTIRFLLSSCISAATSGGAIGTPAFTAVQVRRPSGRFHGVLNIAATLLDELEFGAIADSSAICFRDLMRKNRLRRKGSEKSWQSSGGESCDLSDGADSTTSSSSAASTALKELNWGRGEKAGKGDMISDGRGLLCGLVKVHLRPYDHNLRFLAASQQEES